jgi:hypothetical protein
MSENKMAEIAKLFGVELDEEFVFELEKRECITGKFTYDKGFVIRIHNSDWFAPLGVFDYLMLGKAKIKKLNQEER